MDEEREGSLTGLFVVDDLEVSNIIGKKGRYQRFS